MSLLSAVAFVVVGLVVLTGGGEALIRGATAVARLAGLAPAVIGLTVVAMGTSLPELAVSVLAALRNQPDVALGNVVGSNIINVSGSLGLAALVAVLPVHGTAVRREWPFMLGATVAAMLAMWGGTITRLEGGLFLAALVAFTAHAVHVGRRDVAGAEAREFAEAVESRDVHAPPGRALLVALGLIGAGVVLLVVGGRALVTGATELARLAGMTERVIGLTIVAAGTGAPELVTSVVAARRGQTDVAVANMIGSNVFNLLGILGTSALITPIAVSGAIASYDNWWMLATTILLYPVLRSGMRVTRAEGAVLVVAYVAYLVTLL